MTILGGGPGTGPGAAVVAVLLVLAGLAVAAGLVILVLATAVGGRGEADPSGRRGEAVYLGVTSFVSLYLAIFASSGVVAALTSLIGPDRRAVRVFQAVPAPLAPVPGLFRSPLRIGRPLIVASPSHNDMVISLALAAGLVALAALAVLLVHRPRLTTMLRDQSLRATPAGRSLMTYLHVSSFVGVFLAALAGAAALYGVYRVIAPGISGSGGRAAGTQELIDSAYLTLAGGWVFLRYNRMARELTEPAPGGGWGP